MPKHCCPVLCVQSGLGSENPSAHIVHTLSTSEFGLHMHRLTYYCCQVTTCYMCLFVLAVYHACMSSAYWPVLMLQTHAKAESVREADSLPCDDCALSLFYTLRQARPHVTCARATHGPHSLATACIGSKTA